MSILKIYKQIKTIQKQYQDYSPITLYAHTICMLCTQLVDQFAHTDIHILPLLR